jgi:hypothetical protein
VFGVTRPDPAHASDPGPVVASGCTAAFVCGSAAAFTSTLPLHQVPRPLRPEPPAGKALAAAVVGNVLGDGSWEGWHPGIDGGSEWITHTQWSAFESGFQLTSVPEQVRSGHVAAVVSSSSSDGYKGGAVGVNARVAWCCRAWSSANFGRDQMRNVAKIKQHTGENPNCWHKLTSIQAFREALLQAPLTFCEAC